MSSQLSLLMFIFCVIFYEPAGPRHTEEQKANKHPSGTSTKLSLLMLAKINRLSEEQLTNAGKKKLV